MNVLATRVAMPEEAYLIKLGQLAYIVASLEWLVLGDLPSLSPALPADLTLGRLADCSTGTLASELRRAAALIREPDVQAYIAAAASALEDAATRRNHVLHARPATVDGRQRLHRWKKRGAVAFTVEHAYLDVQISEIDQRFVALNSLRYPARAAVQAAKG